MGVKHEAVDETAFARPDIIQWWVDMGGQPMEANMLHRYISESPFFDYTTKNGLAVTQGRTNAATHELIHDRARFEDTLCKQRGTEYIVVGDPQKVPDGPWPGGTNGMWVIRKQDRDKVRAADGRVQDELTTLGTYYVVGETMFQAVSVADMVGNRLLNATTNLNKFFDRARRLPEFEPGTGFSYRPSSTKAAPGLTAASPAQSREGSVVAGEAQSARSASVQTSNPNGAQTQNQSAFTEDRLLERSLRLAFEFGDEYVDENPVIGEPGHFAFTSSKEAVKKRKAEELAAADAAIATAQARAEKASTRAANLKAEKPPSPPAVMTEGRAGKVDKEKKPTRMADKARRKKRRSNMQTPSQSTPATPTAAG